MNKQVIESQPILFWTGFNSVISENKAICSTITYARVVDTKPSDMATIFPTMKRCFDMSRKLRQVNFIQTSDQQLYAIGQHVKWSSSHTFSSHIFRHGGFHTTSCYISSIGKLRGNGGLRDLLNDSRVFAVNIFDQAISGKQLNRAVRGLILGYEAFTFVFLSHSLTGGQLKIILIIYRLKCRKTYWYGMLNLMKTVMRVADLKAVFELHVSPILSNFKKWGIEKSPTLKYWIMFIDAVGAML